MKIQIFSQYYNLAQVGRVKPLTCPNHYDETGLFSKALYLLNHKEKDNKIILYCTACNYEQTAGLQLYENILNKIKEIKNV